MSIAAIVFTLIAGLFLFRLRRDLAALPLVFGATYITLGSSLEIGPFHFTVIRLLIAIGIVRVTLRKERIAGRFNGLDKMMVLWSVCAVISSIFHEPFGEALVFRLGLAYNALGIYFLLRTFIATPEEVRGLGKLVVIALLPIALEMVAESQSGRDLFSFLGGVPDFCEIRNGKIRAQGPFAHSILAGTVGAVCIPLAVLLWRENRKLSIAGIAAAAAIVVCSRSSGPAMTAVFVVAAIALWKFRRHMRLIRWGSVAGIVALSLVMKAPIYYILDRIDLTGGSTGWHRAILIESSVKHVGDWWLGGTDFTRDWTPESGSTDNETDITNHYIRMAVWGGLPMLSSFVGSIIIAFTRISHALKARWSAPDNEQFLIWSLGCILFGHVATMMSVSYFDQSVFFLYLALASVGSIATRVEVESSEWTAVQSRA